MIKAVLTGHTKGLGAALADELLGRGIAVLGLAIDVGRIMTEHRTGSVLQGLVDCELPEGIVLRYGRLYGPGTGVETPPANGPLHVSAAARAALLACTKASPGIYNIAEDDGWANVSKAAQLLDWRP